MSCGGDLDLGLLGGLDLERLVDQVAEHLLAQGARPRRRESAPSLAIASSARRWSMSVWVMTSPLTIAVALTTDGRAWPKNCGFCGRSKRARAVGAAGALAPHSGPLLPVATASANAAATNRARAGKRSNAAATVRKSLVVPTHWADWPLSSPAERRLSGRDPSERYSERECASLRRTRRRAHSRAATRRQARGIRPHRRCRAGGGPARSRRPATADLPPVR